MPGKLAAIDQHFGPKWMDKLILTHDKTIVLGDVLIDDKGIITGTAVPTWKHMITTSPTTGTSPGNTG